MDDLVYRRSKLIVGVSLAVAAGVLLYNGVRFLEQVRSATRVPGDEATESTPLLISRRTEDAIKTETLGTLYESPNHDIRQAATKMLAERVFRTSAHDALLRTVSSRRAAKQTRALACLRYLHTSAPVSVPAESQVQAIYALVDFLAGRNRLVAGRAHAPEETDWRTRPRAERDALAALAVLAPPRLLDVVHAGAVTKWLAHYPFGGRDAPRQRRRDVVRRLCERQSDDVDLATLLTALMCSADGRRQLRAAGLIGSNLEEAKGEGFDGPDRATAAAAGVVFGDYASYNRPGHGVEEAAIRRRRRQAMVYGEQGQPVTRDNIYEAEPPDFPWEMATESDSDAEPVESVHD